ncbi:MAG: UDP-glucose/GDP-mannose dehydrogenase family protein [Candidatus Aenigmatarchaeota archaeon]
MKISIIGSGYVGLSTGLGLASLGYEIICVDVDRGKVDSINNGKLPIYEDGMQEILNKALKKKTFKATTDFAYAIENSEVSFVAVGTPFKDGLYLKYVMDAVTDISKALKSKKGYHLVVMKSTVLPGTTESIIPILEKSSKKRVGKDIGLCMNPEFLREGKALDDFLKPDRIVIGEFDKKSGDALEKLYKGVNAPVFRTNLKTAEMIKYAANTFLASKISLINEIGNICKKLGIDTYDVAKGIGYDKRISPQFLESGIGFGGSCFKKDLSALAKKAKSLGVDTRIIDATLCVNENQPLKITEFLKDVKNKKVTILGLAFKPGTDDIRESPAIRIISELLRKGACVSAYDPKAMDNVKRVFPNITYCRSAKEALENADACVILTEWEEFKKLSEKEFSVMKNKVIVEGRKTLNPKIVKKFDGVCW